MPTTQPPGTDTAAVTPVLQALVDRHDAAVAAVLSDPRVARDPESPALREYVGLFVQDTAFPTTVITAWQRDAEAGRYYAPGPAGVLRASTVTTVTAVSADEVEFDVCIVDSIVVSDEAGNVLESSGGVDAGRLRANRVGGVWLLRDLTRIPPEGCPEPTPATPTATATATEPAS